MFFFKFNHINQKGAYPLALPREENSPPRMFAFVLCYRNAGRDEPAAGAGRGEAVALEDLPHHPARPPHTANGLRFEQGTYVRGHA